ncbi:Neprilysin-21 [Nymphon striatum]|nr:Neprilysin-21 [Nymphon striatum]
MVEQITDDVVEAFKRKIDATTWSDNATKEKSNNKLDSMDYLIGYPTWILSNDWIDEYYKQVFEVRWGNIFSGTCLDTAAEYNPTKNLLRLFLSYFKGQLTRSITMANEGDLVVFPAAQVQGYLYEPRAKHPIIPSDDSDSRAEESDTEPENSDHDDRVGNTNWTSITEPSFVAQASEQQGNLMLNYHRIQQCVNLCITISAVNYGTLGSVIGHELVHALDKIGHKFSEIGMKNNWWTNEVQRKYDNSTRCLALQYNQEMFGDTGIINLSEEAISENVADNEGIKQAYGGYELWWERNQDENETLPGMQEYSPQQLFFISMANAICTTKKNIHYKIENEMLNPEMYRVNIPLSNFEEFSRAFKCKKGSKMNPDHKCAIW